MSMRNHKTVQLSVNVYHALKHVAHRLHVHLYP